MTKINRAAGLENPLQKIFPQPVVASRAPAATDKRYPIGQIWVDKALDKVHVLTSVSSGSPTWSILN